MLILDACACEVFIFRTPAMTLLKAPGHCVLLSVSRVNILQVSWASVKPSEFPIMTNAEVEQREFPLCFSGNASWPAGVNYCPDRRGYGTLGFFCLLSFRMCCPAATARLDAACLRSTPCSFASASLSVFHCLAAALLLFPLIRPASTEWHNLMLT